MQGLHVLMRQVAMGRVLAHSIGFIACFDIWLSTQFLYAIRISSLSLSTQDLLQSASDVLVRRLHIDEVNIQGTLMARDTNTIATDVSSFDFSKIVLKPSAG
eukprot:TRINITY_DN108609_c0_g1_i1.p1 TRINITY_DN108609_c0_g1~~TRINITY_DN108609_c0_g1_i1.p1  ORF type:complete len:102 (+),score=9.41 TRINITY_DN108609_c0_g1_i1:227-532(+)